MEPYLQTRKEINHGSYPRGHIAHNMEQRRKDNQQDITHKDQGDPDELQGQDDHVKQPSEEPCPGDAIDGAEDGGEEAEDEGGSRGCYGLCCGFGHGVI